MLDDVWTAEQLGAFEALTAEGGLLGRLVTTRNDELVGDDAQKVDALEGDEGRACSRHTSAAARRRTACAVNDARGS